MATKQAAPREYFDDCVSTSTEPTRVSAQLRIPGLRQMADGTFVLEDVLVREIDWELVAKGLGRKFVPDALAAEIDKACFRYSVAEVIAERAESVED